MKTETSTSLVEHLLRVSDQYGETIAIRAKRKQITYVELATRIRNMAFGLTATGFAPGDFVLFSVRPGIEAIVMASAVLAVGGTLVFADPGMSEELFRNRLSTVPVRWSMAESQLYAISSSRILRKLISKRGLHLPQISKLDVRHIRTGPWLPGIPRKSLKSHQLQKQHTPVSLKRPSNDAPALIVFTSGSTAQPKAVQHSYQGITRTFEAIAPLLNMHAGDILYSDELHTIIPALLAGACIVFPSRNASSSQRLNELARVNPTHLFGVPFEIHQLVQACRNSHMKLPQSIATIMMGSAPVSNQLLESLYSVCTPNVQAWCIYAMTELFPIAYIEGHEKLAFSSRGDVVGFPVPSVSIAIAEDHEVSISSPLQCTGFWGEAPLEKVLSGDLGRFDDQGRLVLIGRKKEMIIRKHFNIYPGLYESQISAFPGITACKMVGIYEPHTNDETIVLFVELQEQGREKVVIKALKENFSNPNGIVDAWAVPDHILVTVLPRSGRSSKIDVRELKERGALYLLGHP